jgi:hypothetical protein
MANRKTYRDEFIHQLLYEKAQGATLKELSSKYSLTNGQLNYCVYVRGHDLRVPAPPLRMSNIRTRSNVISPIKSKNLWQKIKNALKW